MSSSGVAFAGQKPTAARASSRSSATIRARSARASSSSSRACGPTTGSDRIAGKAPRSSQVAKNGPQSIRSDQLRQRVVGERRAPPGRRGAAASRDQSTAGRLARASAIVRRCSRLARPSRSRRTVSYSSRTVAAKAARPAWSRSDPATPTAREASATWMTGPRVRGRDLDRGVQARGRRAADQQRDRHALALHLGGDVDHLVERWRDQPGQADQVGADLACRLEDPSTRAP